jgi:hypothetical protein
MKRFLVIEFRAVAVKDECVCSAQQHELVSDRRGHLPAVAM